MLRTSPPYATGQTETLKADQCLMAADYGTRGASGFAAILEIESLSESEPFPIQRTFLV